jgi:mono/diheme cytochrome c family protein
MRNLLKLTCGAALIASAGGCSPDSGDPRIARGRQIYLTNCTACHAQDPSQPGPVGPEIAGSSLELLRAKVLRNEYPPGYTPRRDTRAMVPLAHLEPELDALAAFLAGAED